MYVANIWAMEEVKMVRTQHEKKLSCTFNMFYIVWTVVATVLSFWRVTINNATVLNSL